MIRLHPKRQCICKEWWLHRPCCSTPHLLFLFVLVAQLKGTYTLNSVVVFGTRNGYDIDGGTDPICWVSQADPSPLPANSNVLPPPTSNINQSISSSNTTSSSSTLDALQSLLFNQRNSSGVQILPQCYNGTNMTIQPAQSVRDTTDWNDSILGYQK